MNSWRRIVPYASCHFPKTLQMKLVAGRISEAFIGKVADATSAFHSSRLLAVEASIKVLAAGVSPASPGNASVSETDVQQGAQPWSRTATDEARGTTSVSSASSSPTAAQFTYSGVPFAAPPLAGWQRAAIAFGSAVGALADPARADLVAALGETTGIGAFHRMLAQMRQSEEGQRLLREKPRVTAEAVAHAWECPPGTFGAAYAHFMGSRNFSADDRPTVRFVDDQDLAFVASRAREVHDFWHVLFALPTNVTGELSLKMVELVQTGMPMCALSVIGGPLRLSADKRQVLRSHYFPWAIKAALKSVDLMSIKYEDHFHEDLGLLRKRWRIIPAPKRQKIER